MGRIAIAAIVVLAYLVALPCASARSKPRPLRDAAGAEATASPAVQRSRTTAAVRKLGNATRLVECLRSIEGQPETKLPGSPDYDLYGNGLRIMDIKTPAAVVYPDTAAQVQAAVTCATAAGVRPIPRGGGFSFENLATGDGALVIDMTNMHKVTVDASAMTATVQAGIRMGNLYYEIFRQGRQAGGRNLTCLGGTYPQIGFGGILSAGGYGAFTRKFGLLSDSLLSATVVDAAGRLLQVDEATHPDLLFALRGGGGGTYGIVVEAKIRVFEVPVVTLARIKMPDMTQAVELFDRYQQWAPDAPPELGQLKFNLRPSTVDINMQYMGTRQELEKLLREQSGLMLPGALYEDAECDVQASRAWTPDSGVEKAEGGGWRKVAHFMQAPYCTAHEATLVPQRAEPGGPLAFMREASQYRSAYFKDLLPRKALEAISKEFVNPEPPVDAWRQLLCRVHGPGVTKFADDYSAFGNRRDRMVCEYGTSFATLKSIDSVPKAVQAPIWSWFAKARDVIDRYDTGDEYNGWLNQFDKVRRFFGPNYGELRDIKRRYDPENVFWNDLSVKPRRHAA